MTEMTPEDVATLDRQVIDRQLWRRIFHLLMDAGYDTAGMEVILSNEADMQRVRESMGNAVLSLVMAKYEVAERPVRGITFRVRGAP